MKDKIETGIALIGVIIVVSYYAITYFLPQYLRHVWGKSENNL